MAKDNNLQTLVHEAYKNIRDMAKYNRNEFSVIFDDAVKDYREKLYDLATGKFTDAMGIIDNAESTRALILSLKGTLGYDMSVEDRAGTISRVLSLYEKQIAVWPNPQNYGVYIAFLLSKNVNNENINMSERAVEIGEEGVKRFPNSRDLHAIISNIYKLVKNDLSSHISMLRACENSLYDFKFLERNFDEKLMQYMPNSENEATIPITHIWSKRKSFENNPIFLEDMLRFEQEHNYGGTIHRIGIINILLELLNKSYRPDALFNEIIPKEIELSPGYKEALDGMLEDLKLDFDMDSTSKPETLKKNLHGKQKTKNKAIIPKGELTSLEKALPSLEKTINKSLTPKSIKAELDKYVVGQEDAKQIISNALYNHYLRINTNAKWQKGNIILMGPTGCGKTFLAAQIARIMDVPFAVGDCTSISEVGYVGNDADDVLKTLHYDAKQKKMDINTGIVYLDEIDKIAVAQDGFGRDVRGRGVQQPFLKMVEGSKYKICLNKYAPSESFEIDTTPILFIAGGSFAGDSGKRGLLELAYAAKTSQGKVGFNTEARISREDIKLYSPTDKDMKEFGFIPEFIGRFPIRSFLSELTEEQLAEIMIKPEDAVLKQKQAYFQAFGVKLKMTDDAVKLIAAEAKKSSTGARSLHSITNIVLKGLEFELPGSDVKEVEITKQFVEERIAAK